MSSIDPAAESVALPEQTAAKPVPPAVRIAKDFLESPLAVLGLAILSVVILVAVFAPLIAPQNPYDLSEIRLEDSRQPPGSQRMTPPWETDLRLTIGPGVAGNTEITFSEQAPVESAVLSWTLIDGENAVAIRLIFAPSLEGIPLEPLRLDDLPRGSELNIGEKHSFRSFWTVEASDLEDFTLSSRRALDRPFELELAMKATEGEALMTYWLGTDGQGRDMLSAIMYGLRTSLAVGVVSCFFAMMIGLSLGMIAAFFGGRIETIIMRIVDLQLSFPTILVALMLLAILGSGVEKVMLALIIVQWAYFARTARSVALVERGKEYMEAAQCLALSKARVIFRHLLPNCLPPIIVVATVQVANAIALEATLSFLGIGLPVTEPSLGLLISNGFEFMLSGRYWISVYPGVALLITIIAINLVGDRLRDVLNPRLNR